MTRTQLTIAIVIPAYNEEDQLHACLDAIAKQTVPPKQVIVVDNNSTDKTAEIARSYGFVTLLHEKRQSQVFAQKTGFKHVTAHIIGRIDCDVRLPVDWCERVIAFFQDHPDTVAITGSYSAYDVPLGWAGTWIFDLYHHLLSKIASGHVMLWGSNCAMRADAVHQIADRLLQRGDIWEDYDLSFCLAPLGTIQFLRHLKVGNSFRAAHKPLGVQIVYQIRAVRTYFLRTNRWRAILFTFFWSTLIFIYPIPLLDRFLYFIKTRFTARD